MPSPLPPVSRQSPPRRVLMIAFHFPPFAVSSGVQRTLRFVQQLPEFGWQPLVLSAAERAYTETSLDLLKQIPAGTVVHRAFALDTARHLALAGRYPGFLARPDRWRTWALGAVPAGLNLIRKFRPDVIWSTYPIATAHLIAERLHRLTGIPWVADFRDPMAQEGYPSDPRTWRSFEQIEAATARSAARLSFVTPSALRLYRQRYGAIAGDRFVMIENGYDEESFRSAEQGLDPTPLNPGHVTLLHSGIVYPEERDPTALFEALGRLRVAGQLDAMRLRLRFRASKHEGLLQELAHRTATEPWVEIVPPLPYHDALQEMLRADGLLVMQGANCNEQVPAKVYEYLRASRPVLGLADPKGDTAEVLRNAGVAHIAALEDSAGVEAALRSFLGATGRPSAPSLGSADLAAMSRASRAGQLAQLLDEVSAQSRAALCAHAA